MQQIKCNVCQFTKFFVNAVGQATVLSCSECGASFISQSLVGPEKEIKPEKGEPLQSPKEEETEKPEEPVSGTVIKQVSEKVETEKPVARKMTQQEKQARVLEMENDGGE